MRVLPSRLWLKERVGRSRLLQWAYATSTEIAARALDAAGRPFLAARLLLRAWKHVDADLFGARRAHWAGVLIERHTRRDGVFLGIADNGFYRDFVRSGLARDLRAKYGEFPPGDRVRLRYPRSPDDPERQGDLIILKSPDPLTGEKGVILVMYHEGIEAAAAVLDLPRLAPHWTFVLETSNWGSEDARFLPYIGADLSVIVMAPRAPDAAWLNALKTNLNAVQIGSGEWVDPATFQAGRDGGDYLYDVLMIASWDPLKRHELLFRAIADLKARGRPLKVGLIGIPMRWRRDQVEALAVRYGVKDCVTVHERIPHAEVARLVRHSRVSVLLSRQEGSNRAVYESLFAGTPVVVYARHKGINLEHVNPMTGLLAEDDELADRLLEVIDHPERFDPRRFALENLGYPNAVRGLNAALKERALQDGRPWTRDIVAKRNAPNSRYVTPGIYREFEPDYAALADYLQPRG